MKYQYFRDPDNYSYKIDEESDCAICGKIGIWFDGGGFFGVEEIDCICDSCLESGKLKELRIETNSTLSNIGSATEIILYKTPPLPTVQDGEWPIVNGNYCIFEKIASKPDFVSEEEFNSSFSDSDREEADLEWLWSVLPEVKITSLANANYDITVYLFSAGNNKYCTWDAS